MTKPLTPEGEAQHAFLHNLHATEPKLATLCESIIAEKSQLTRIVRTANLTLATLFHDQAALPSSLIGDVVREVILLIAYTAQAEILSAQMQLAIEEDDPVAVTKNLPISHRSAFDKAETVRSRLVNLMALVVEHKEKCNAKHRL